MLMSEHLEVTLVKAAVVCYKWYIAGIPTLIAKKVAAHVLLYLAVTHQHRTYAAHAAVAFVGRLKVNCYEVLHYCTLYMFTIFTAVSRTQFLSPWGSSTSTWQPLDMIS